MTDSVLLISTEAVVCGAVERACAEIGARVHRVDDLDRAAGLLDGEGATLVLSDFETFAALRKDRPSLCGIVLADGADSEQAIEWMMQGALDYVLKPLNHDGLVRAIRDALRVSRDVEVPAYDQADERAPTERMVGQSPAMQEVYKLIGLLAPRDVNVLITGESGTGKDLVARALCQHSARKDRPFLAVNCAAIPETLLESELFGHEKGAFTGADRRRIGKFEQCDGGTLFLDEIGDIPLATQAKLLRVLQDRSFQRLGGTQVVQCDVRILAATNQALESLIAEKRFREDLYYRLKVASIELPPLRDREVDAVLLAHYFVRRFNRQLATQVRRFAPETLSILLRYNWPGNVRELENAVKAALAVARGSVFRPELLPARIQQIRPEQADARGELTRRDPPTGPPTLRSFAEKLVADPSRVGRLHRDAIDAVERELIRACLLATDGRLAPAARKLGITRTTLRKKITQFGLQITTAVDVPPPASAETDQSDH